MRFSPFERDALVSIKCTSIMSGATFNLIGFYPMKIILIKSLSKFFCYSKNKTVTPPKLDNCVYLTRWVTGKFHNLN
jgi:hypothetical protein